MKERQAYETMFEFLRERYRLLPSDALGGLLGDLQLLGDGEPADPAMAQEWEQAVLAVTQAANASSAKTLRMAS